MKYQRIVGQSIAISAGNLVRAINMPIGAEMLDIRGTGTTTSFNFFPRLIAAFYFDSSAGTYTSAAASLTDRGNGTTVVLNSFEASVDFFYIGCRVPFRGIYVNVVNAQSNLAVLQGEYWSGSVWSDIGVITDGTSSGTATFAIDNSATWTVPTNWTKTTVSTALEPLFWVRLSTDATWDSSVSIAELMPLPVQPTGAAANGAANLTVATDTAVSAPCYEFNPEFVGGIEMTGADLDALRLDWFGRMNSRVAVD